MALDDQATREKIVRPRQLECWNIHLWNNVAGVKVHYDCGECGYTQKVRVPVRDEPVVECKHCKTLNKFPLVT